MGGGRRGESNEEDEQEVTFNNLLRLVKHIKNKSWLRDGSHQPSIKIW